MSEFLSTLLWICGVVGSVWLAFVPWQILKEIRESRVERRASDARVVALLQMIARGEKPAPYVSDDERLQAAIDSRANPE